MVKVISGVRERLPKIPIGVEPYVTSREDIEQLHNAGATEIKINLETPDPEIFKKICKDLDYEGIEQALDFAVGIFGKNNVCSNLIVGLGESVEDLLMKVEEFASRGIVATLRGVRVNELNTEKLKQSLGFIPEPVKPERLLNLAERQKEILEKYELSTSKFETMCHKCRCCDIVPQQDI
jgi:biotin synthase-related radical SAM superfamily protein